MKKDVFSITKNYRGKEVIYTLCVSNSGIKLDIKTPTTNIINIPVITPSFSYKGMNIPAITRIIENEYVRLNSNVS